MSVDEKERENIEAETKKLLDKFSKALSSIKDVEESNVEGEEDRREEDSDKEIKESEESCGSDFRRIMFENATQKNKDFIIAEKKNW